jgi:hypothetical protein
MSNKVGNVSICHQLRMAATVSLLLSLVVAMIFLVSQRTEAPNSTSSEVLLSSHLNEHPQTLKATIEAVSKTRQNLKLYRSKEALKSLEVLAALRHAVVISIPLFPILIWGLIIDVQDNSAKQEIDPKFMVNVTKQALATLPLSLQKLGAFMASLSFVEGQEGVDCTRSVPDLSIHNVCIFSLLLHSGVQQVRLRARAQPIPVLARLSHPAKHHKGAMPHPCSISSIRTHAPLLLLLHHLACQSTAARLGRRHGTHS